MAKKNEHDYLVFPEACDYMRISKETLYRLTTAKKIKFYRVGRKFLFTKEDMDNFIRNSNKKTPRRKK